MGHEFVELKNTGGAVEAYRKAVGGYFGRSGGSFVFI